MQFSVTVYQRAVGQIFVLHPICPGLFDWQTFSRDPGKARQRLIERLRREIPKLSSQEFSRLAFVPDRHLQRVRIEFAVRADGEKKRVAGVFPLVVESRPAGSGRLLRIAYHPMAPTNWVELDPESDLESQARRLFSRVLTPDSPIDSMRSDGREKLTTARFSAPTPSLLDLLKKQRGPQLLGAGSSGQLADLLRVAQNYSSRAADGGLALGLQRDKLRARMQQLLCGASKAPTLVVGPPGCGKTTLIHQAVHDLLDADDYPAHRNLSRTHNVLRVQGRHIIAGMSYVGQWEQRCVDLLRHAKKRRVILWADDVHAWATIGRTVQSERALADFFRGPLARRELIVIGECTPEQLSILEQDAPALASTFARVVVPSADPGQTLGMMLHEARELEAELEVAFDPLCFRTIVDLSNSLSGATALPGRALLPLKALARNAAESGSTSAIGPEQAIEHFSKQTGLPIALLNPGTPLQRDVLRAELAQQIKGQPDALDAACDLILNLRAGLCAPGRPYGVFLFTGPTGTGKTELAKCLAEYLFSDASRLLRFDMGEYSAGDACSRLIGDRFEPEGQLTAAVRAQPFCVLLLDEIEKAHPSVLNLMLQLFDDARLTDASGNVADFSHAVIVMTSNLGSSEQMVQGFLDDRAAQANRVDRAVREFFPPELFNRIDRVVSFSPLSRQAAHEIARKELARLAGRPGLAERNIFVKFSEAVVALIVEEGYDAKYGARAIKRYIDRHVGDLLTRAIVADRSASMRLLWLYAHRPPLGTSVEASASEIRVYSEALAEAPPASSASANESLLQKDHGQLLKEVPPALQRLRELEDGKIARLAEQLRQELQAFRLGEDRADQIYNLDWLRDQLQRLQSGFEERIAHDLRLEKLERVRKYTHGELMRGEDFSALGEQTYQPSSRERLRPSHPPESLKQRGLLSELAEVAFVSRLLQRAEEPAQHVVVIDLVRMAAHFERRRFSEGTPGLLEWLSLAYCKARGELELAAVRFADGRCETAATLPGLEKLLCERPRQVTLRLVGPGVATFLAGETGCHLRQVAGAGPEIVRVQVVATRESPELYQEQHAASYQAFEQALEGSTQTPDNPESLLPVVRSVRFDPPAAERATASIEDYRFAYVASRRVRQLSELLEDFWWLGAGVVSTRAELAPTSFDEQQSQGADA